MKRILISAVLALALAGTSAFAAQNKNAAKKPAAKTTNTAMAKTAAKAANSNAGGTMKAKTKNKNM